MIKTVYFILVAFLVAGCADAPQVSPTVQPTQISLPPTVAPTAAVSPTVPPTATPTRAPAATSTPTSIPTSAPTTVPVGLGISRADGARMFQFFEFQFELQTGEDQQEIFLGTISDRLGEVWLYGTKEDIYRATLKVQVPQPPTDKQSMRTITYLTTMLTVFAEEWAGGVDWLNESMNAVGEESRTRFGDKEAILVLTPDENMMGVELTIWGDKERDKDEVNGFDHCPSDRIGWIRLIFNVENLWFYRTIGETAGFYLSIDTKTKPYVGYTPSISTRSIRITLPSRFIPFFREET